MLRDSRGIGRIVVHVVTSAHLRGATVTASVMSHDTIAFGNKKQHLSVPIVRR